jgi:hypothetical protein
MAERWQSGLTSAALLATKHPGFFAAARRGGAAKKDKDYARSL